MENRELIPYGAIYSFKVSAADVRQRIDKFLLRQFSSYSRNFLQKLIEEECVSINNKKIEKANILTKENDIVQVVFPPARIVDVEKIVDDLGIEVIFEHNDFVIVYKPANLLMHAPTQYSTSITLADWIKSRYKAIDTVGYIDRPGIVHRLDKDTSGLLVIPLTNYAHAEFSKLFKDRLIEKTYLAVVQGHLDISGTIDFPIGRDPINKTRMAAFKKVDSRKKATIRDARTHYKVLSYYDNAALVEVKPVTGRTHQIRVHLAAIGHPIIGDSVYGKKSKLIERQALHAYALKFVFNDQPFHFAKELPEDMKKLIDILQKSGA